MDPITVLGLIATCAKLASLCADAASGLHSLHSKQNRAASSLLAMRRECTTLGAAVEGIKVWAESSTAQLESRKAQCAALDKALKTLVPSIQVLTDDTDEILRKFEDGSIGIAAKIKYLWKEEDMKVLLEEIRWQSQHIHTLLTTVSL